MSEEKTEVALVSLPATPAELEAAFINDEYIEGLITSIREKALPVVGDLNKAAGRRVYISMAATVRSTKAMIDKAGKDLVADMKKRPALVDASRLKVREALDELAVEIRKPVTDWEAEQERIRIEEEAKAEAERYSKMRDDADKENAAFDLAKAKELALKIEADHATALLDNYEYDSKVAEEKAEAERQRIAHEEELKRQAIEQARIANEAEIAAIAKREADAKAAIAKLEQDAKDAAALAERQRIEADAKAAREKQEAAEQAERDKQAAIEAEQLRAKQEADRIRLEAEQKEQARLAEEKRIADEAAKRAKDTEHRRTVNRTAVADLIKEGIPDEFARKCVEAVARMKIKNMTINY